MGDTTNLADATRFDDGPRVGLPFARTDTGTSVLGSAKRSGRSSSEDIKSLSSSSSDASMTAFRSRAGFTVDRGFNGDDRSVNGEYGGGTGDLMGSDDLNPVPGVPGILNGDIAPRMGDRGIENWGTWELPWESCESRGAGLKKLVIAAFLGMATVSFGSKGLLYLDILSTT